MSDNPHPERQRDTTAAQVAACLTVLRRTADNSPTPPPTPPALPPDPAAYRWLLHRLFGGQDGNGEAQ
jgi:hypothetical protein